MNLLVLSFPGNYVAVTENFCVSIYRHVVDWWNKTKAAYNWSLLPCPERFIPGFHKGENASKK